MPKRNDDWKAIDKRIADAIEAAIAPLKPSGWRKALFFLREWGVLATTATVIVALLALAATAFYQATARVGKQAEFETNTARDLTDIRKDISGIRSELAKLTLSTNVALPLADFKANLPALRSSLANARKQESKIPPKLVENLQAKLTATGTDVPNFWPTAAEFISYRSFSTTSWSPVPALPDCTALTPQVDTFSPGFAAGGQPLKLDVKMGSYRNCRLTLDSPEDGKRLNELLADMPVIGFYRCVVVYRGGPIALALAGPHVVASASGKNGAAGTVSAASSLQFVECLFDFSIQESTPPPVAQQLTKLVLDQNTPTIVLPIRSAS